MVNEAGCQGAEQLALEDGAQELAAAKASPEGASLSPEAQALYEAEGAARYAEHHPTRHSIRVRRTPNCRHLYRATAKGFGCYGWGNTPTEARERLARNMEEELEERRQRATLKAATQVP